LEYGILEFGLWNTRF